jgi:hypothetical protein
MTADFEARLRLAEHQVGLGGEPSPEGVRDAWVALRRGESPDGVSATYTRDLRLFLVEANVVSGDYIRPLAEIIDEAEAQYGPFNETERAELAKLHASLQRGGEPPIG